tara:strand:+ start:2343 stop:2564 length:222 start_codon:yes stop_codon:yes gene_type:complete
VAHATLNHMVSESVRPIISVVAEVEINQESMPGIVTRRHMGVWRSACSMKCTQEQYESNGYNIHLPKNRRNRA